MNSIGLAIKTVLLLWSEWKKNIILTRRKKNTENKRTEKLKDRSVHLAPVSINHAFITELGKCGSVSETGLIFDAYLTHYNACGMVITVLFTLVNTCPALGFIVQSVWYISANQLLLLILVLRHSFCVLLSRCVYSLLLFRQIHQNRFEPFFSILFGCLLLFGIVVIIVECESKCIPFRWCEFLSKCRHLHKML